MNFAQWKMWDNFAHTYGYDSARNKMRYALYDTPVFGNYIKFEQGINDAEAYLKNRGLTWADAYRVGNLPGAGTAYNAISSPTRAMRNFTSKNILSLYR